MTTALISAGFCHRLVRRCRGSATGLKLSPYCLLCLVVALFGCGAIWPIGGYSGGYPGGYDATRHAYAPGTSGGPGSHASAESTPAYFSVPFSLTAFLQPLLLILSCTCTTLSPFALSAEEALPTTDHNVLLSAVVEPASKSFFWQVRSCTVSLLH